MNQVTAGENGVLVRRKNSNERELEGAREKNQGKKRKLRETKSYGAVSSKEKRREARCWKN